MKYGGRNRDIKQQLFLATKNAAYSKNEPIESEYQFQDTVNFWRVFDRDLELMNQEQDNLTEEEKKFRDSLDYWMKYERNGKSKAKKCQKNHFESSPDYKLIMDRDATLKYAYSKFDIQVDENSKPDSKFKQSLDYWTIFETDRKLREKSDKKDFKSSPDYQMILELEPKQHQGRNHSNVSPKKASSPNNENGVVEKEYKFETSLDYWTVFERDRNLRKINGSSHSSGFKSTQDYHMLTVKSAEKKAKIAAEEAMAQDEIDVMTAKDVMATGDGESSQGKTPTSSWTVKGLFTKVITTIFPFMHINTS